MTNCSGKIIFPNKNFFPPIACNLHSPNRNTATIVTFNVNSYNIYQRYTGENLQVGDCGISFSHVTSEDAGKWTCHMGPREQLGVEIIDSVLLRVTGPLAANKKEVGSHIGGSVTLFCHTANGNRPLDYCRFLSPNFVGIRLDQTVTESR